MEKYRDVRAARGAAPTERLFHATSQQRTTALRAALHALDVRGTRYSLHSLRHGAASQARLDGLTIAEVADLGRWSSERTAVHYLARARTLGQRFAVSGTALRRGHALHTDRARMRRVFIAAIDEGA